MSDESSCKPLSEQTRMTAARIGELPEVVAESFDVASDVDERIHWFNQHYADLLADMMPVIHWVERRVPPGIADGFKSRVLGVLDSAARCVRAERLTHEFNRHDPEQIEAKALEPPPEGGRRLVALMYEAKQVQQCLDGWAADIEHEEQQRRTASPVGDEGGEENGESPTCKPRGKRGRGRKPPTPDEIERDNRVFDAWETRGYKTFEELGRALKMEGKVARRTVQRVRKRRNK